jgi:hypothetical protein
MFCKATSRCRSAVHVFLTALIVLTLAHCSWEAAHELAQRARTTLSVRLGLPIPLEQPAHDCGHESGCLCRGATVVVPIAAPDWRDSGLSQWLLDLNDRPIFIVAEVSLVKPTLDPHQHAAPPLFGRILRARYASFVI